MFNKNKADDQRRLSNDKCLSCLLFKCRINEWRDKMSSNFVMPKQIISGAGALNNAKDVFKKAGKKALIVLSLIHI